MSSTANNGYEPPQNTQDAVEGLLNLLSCGSTEEQREAAEVLACLAKQRKQNSDVIVNIGAIPLFVELLSCPDMTTRGNVTSMLYEMSTESGTEAISIIHEMLKRGPGPKGSETAAKILVGLAKFEGLKEPLGAAGGIAALVDILRYRSTRTFQKEAVAALSCLLLLNENKVRAAKDGIVPVLVRLIKHGSPTVIDVDGILALLTLLATHEVSRGELLKMDCSVALSKVLKDGSIQQKERAASILLALNCDQAQLGSGHVLGSTFANGADSSQMPPNMSSKVTRDRIGHQRVSSPPGLTIPDEFRCPISLELMRDPVDVATGQTYERQCIEKWLHREGENPRTCPKTRQRLAHLNLKPNYRLAMAIKEWCDRNGVNLQRTNSFTTSQSLKRCDELDPARPCMSLRDKEKIRSLLLILSTEDPNVASKEKRAVTKELCQFAKNSRDHCNHIVEAGVVPSLSKLLASNHDVSTQEEAIATILLLSINEENKRPIAASGAINAIVELLRHGSMEARENAAAALFSLSIVDENKVAIGLTDAIPALVDLLVLEKVSPRAQKDAATALKTLIIYQGNKASAVRAGVVPHLLRLLKDEGLKMVDLVLAILTVLCNHFEGRAALERENSLPTFIEIMRSGSNQHKEDALSIMSALMFNNPGLIHEGEQFGMDIIITELSESGTQRIRMKAQALLDFFKKNDS